ncbi:hypothetical protein MUY27_19095 [Mucilaginibacter sp. RS28]|uniref:Uncharacterized protein n=1 Tax=Mucilaginibacter straminoryzae TaxID=2932774 RepID=A0A9X1XBQ9_9SPHI|nr:hypothetical protein [Mucilaginibacter straminoryzae]MCJ8211834.1 hypothetical protein [Mucilaginibacter straminoryzae]
MDNKSINKEVSELQKLNDRPDAIEQKLDELLLLLENSNLDSESIKNIQNKFNSAIDAETLKQQDLHEFRKLDELSENTSREELLDQFSLLLTNSKIDSNVSKQFIRRERLTAIVLFAIGVVMIALGFAMIIMPAPPYFEMFTIYYFTPDDGVTIMDVISLLIILAGVYLLVKSLIKKNTIS